MKADEREVRNLYTLHREDLHRTLSFIDNHLKEELTLEIISLNMAISQFHCHRLFHAYSGMTLASYIRIRRLTNAASELLTTDQRILDIALDYQFESQEAFTRAFKKMYHMTPGKYRTFMSKLIYMRERIKMNVKTKEPIGWMLTGSHPTDYEMGVDFKTVHQGKASGYLRSAGEIAGGFATMMQTFKADTYRGQRLQLSGFVKTTDVDGWCGLWMRIDSKEQDAIQFDNMSNRPIDGSTEWTRYDIVLDVPQNSTTISFGTLLNGKGQVWIDSLRFETVSDRIPTTNLEDIENLPDQPVNLSFEEILELE
ncbi:AraC family transcriptional regulator [Paenibacillus albiflavus]|uniref:AraC family transcriptional regulator n=1 Tax=Paenibacillus albiflavus TaxID=2545760 RepID=A0A4R4EG93_9BACL|nr:helix-turn-helix transcriptional regulator [Paenibacillus albiflavus]TCZ78789.1 AraC family transcriptional regulator [Paenibacillus albiflavus]